MDDYGSEEGFGNAAEDNNFEEGYSDDSERSQDYE